jgi:hypothetical protein
MTTCCGCGVVGGPHSITGELQALANHGAVRLGTCLFQYSVLLPATTRGFLTAMLLLRHVSRQRRDVCRPCIRGVFTNARGTREETRWSGEWDDAAARKAAWAAKAGTIRSGAQQSMLSVLEERGFVKDIAG